MTANNDPLRRIALFSTLGEDTLTLLAQRVIRRRYSAGETILLEGETSSAACFIASGQVQVFRTSASGREQVLVNLKAGESFNTVPFFEPQIVSHGSARALTAANLYVLRGEDFLHIIQTCPDLALALLKDFADRLSHLTGLVEQLSLHSMRGRLAHFLINQAERADPPERWTQDAIAAQIGTVRDVVGRTLRSFEDAGLIRRQHNHIILLDRPGLEAEAEG